MYIKYDLITCYALCGDTVVIFNTPLLFRKLLIAASHTCVMCVVGVLDTYISEFLTSFSSNINVTGGVEMNLLHYSMNLEPRFIKSAMLMLPHISRILFITSVISSVY